MARRRGWQDILSETLLETARLLACDWGLLLESDVEGLIVHACAGAVPPEVAVGARLVLPPGLAEQLRGAANAVTASERRRRPMARDSGRRHRSAGQAAETFVLGGAKARRRPLGSAVNDRYGHAIGDAVLRIAGRRIAETAHPRGFVARIGGDEFAIVQISTTRAPRARRARSTSRDASSSASHRPCASMGSRTMSASASASRSARIVWPTARPS